MTISDDKSRQPATVTGEPAPPPGGDELHVGQDGPRDASALLLIHGTAASQRSWDPLVPLLTGSHRVIRIDLLGCGQSAKPDGASYAIGDQARRVGAALDRLGAGLVIAVGHSSGGLVATALAGQRPDLVEEQALPDRLARIGKPLLVIFGADDRRWRSSSAAEYRAVPGATVELLPGLGHSPNLEDPPRTAAPLLAFTANQLRCTPAPANAT